MKETVIWFEPPYKEKCEGCELVRKAKLPAGTHIVITCFAKEMEGAQAEMKYGVEFDDAQRGPDQTLTGTCQAKADNSS